MLRLLTMVSEWSLVLVSVAIIIVSAYDIRDSCKEKRTSKIWVLLVALLISLPAPLRDTLTYTEIKKEDFSTQPPLNNIRFLEKADNIIFRAQNIIEEPINLRVKDTWSNLIYLTDYNIAKNGEIVLSYPFGNNQEYNRGIAKRGLAFTYRTRKWRFSLGQWLKKH